MSIQKFLWYDAKSFWYILKRVIAGSYDSYIFSFGEKVPEWLYWFAIPCTVKKCSSSPSSFLAFLSVFHMLVCAELMVPVVQSDAAFNCYIGLTNTRLITL